MDNEGYAGEGSEAEGGGDDAEWSREWEWPSWVRAAGANLRALRDWRPNGRTFAVVLALVESPAIATTAPIVGGLWRAVSTTPSAPSEFPEMASRYAWDRVLAGADLGSGLAALLIILGAVLVLLAPARLHGFVVVIAGLVLRVASEIGVVVAETHLTTGIAYVAGLAVSCAVRLALLAFAVYVARAGRERMPAGSGADSVA